MEPKLDRQRAAVTYVYLLILQGFLYAMHDKYIYSINIPGVARA